MKRIAIFASGKGSNAQQIIEHFKGSKTIGVALVVTNNPAANVIQVAKEFRIPCDLITRSNLYESDHTLEILKSNHIDLIVLAGFLWMIPEKILHAFPNQIINIHPALLPDYGGSGMYGMKVHQAVLNGMEKETGISIHLVNEKYDEGEIIFQKSIPIEESDTTESLSRKVQQLEHEWYPRVIEKILSPKI